MKKKPNRIMISSLLMTILCIAALALIATLPGGGWWFGAQVQNTNSTSTAAVTYTIYSYDATSTSQNLSNNIGPLASMNYGLNSFNLPNNFQGSSIVNSAQDIRAIVNLTNRFITSFGDPNSPSPAAGQYQGANSAGSPLYFPLVKNDHYAKTTTIIVQNAGTANTNVSAAFHFLNNYNYTYTTPTLKPGQMAIIEPINAHSGLVHPPTNDNTNSVGSVTVTSSQPLAGVALEHMTMEDHATVLQATRGFTSGDSDTTLYAPINKHNSYNRFTGLQVMNVSGGPINITVTYTTIKNNYCDKGTFNDSYNNLLNLYSHTFPSDVLPNNCTASAVIVATGNSIAIVNESFTKDYLITNPGQAQEATAYAAIPDHVATKKLSVPLFKEDSYSKATGLCVQNISGSPAHIQATFKNGSQTFVTNNMDIDPNSAIVLQDMRLLDSTLPSWWHGWDTSNGKLAMNPTTLGCNANGCGANGVFSVILTSDQKIVAVANESTYPIQAPRINQDKSNYEAFNLTP